MKNRAWFCAAGLLLLMGAVTGCQGKYQEVADGRLGRDGHHARPYERD